MSVYTNVVWMANGASLSAVSCRVTRLARHAALAIIQQLLEWGVCMQDIESLSKPSNTSGPALLSLWTYTSPPQSNDVLNCFLMHLISTTSLRPSFFHLTAETWTNLYPDIGSPMQVLFVSDDRVGFGSTREEERVGDHVNARPQKAIARLAV